ncbi:MAG TPA: HAD hydrolase family protein [Victivallales bacterium]|nr:HAD hydrolase family protein [Victivallales bacterium]
MKSIKLIVFDFDGVMTDNRVLVSEDGKESVFCNRSDGIGINILRKSGYKMLILSTEKNRVVKARAKKLKMSVLNGIYDKKKVLCEYCRKNNIKMTSVCYVGNDINDLSAMKSVGVKVCPSDAYSEIKSISDIVLKKAGGDGVVRELATLFTKQ